MYPKGSYLILRVDEIFQKLESVTQGFVWKTDKMAFFMSMVHVLRHQPVTAQQHEDNVREVLRQCDMWDIHVDEEEYTDAAMVVSRCLTLLYHILEGHSVYRGRSMPYHYFQRRGVDSVVLYHPHDWSGLARVPDLAPGSPR